MMKVLIFIVAIIFIAQLVRIFELANLLSKTKNQVTDESNKWNGILMLLAGIGLIVFFFWQRASWMGQTLGKSASEHGPKIDDLWDTTMGLILIVFLILTPMLFGIAYWYRGKKSRKAAYITHNNRLEFFWTAIPAVVLLVLITYGLNVWGQIVNQNISNAMIIEVYAKQFNWTARYAGEDNQLGKANVRFVGGLNELGVISDNTKESQIAIIDAQIDDKQQKIENSINPAEKKKLQHDIDKLDKKRKTLMTYYITTSPTELKAAEDDIVTRELHLPVGQQVLLKFRSQDVIHSAYLPHFRVQMNCVPGTTTQFAFTPTVTTEEMRKDPKIIQQMKEINEIRRNNLAQSTYGVDYVALDIEKKSSINQIYEDEKIEFDYTLLCNKICGAAHYNMQMKVIVETEEEYKKWLESQDMNKIINL